MKLDRNITPGRGKYALIKLRESDLSKEEVDDAIAHNHAIIEVEPEAIDFGDTEDSDFFVIRLKDKYAAQALFAYASAAAEDDLEYGREIQKLAVIARNHPSKKRPD